MKVALIRTIGILILVLLLGDTAACVALLFGFHHRKIEAEPEAFRSGRIASAPLPTLPIARVSLIATPPRPAVAEPPVVIHEESPLAQRTLADIPDRPQHVSPLRMKSMITHAGN